MPEDRHQRYATINLPHTRTVVARIGRARAVVDAVAAGLSGERATDRFVR